MITSFKTLPLIDRFPWNNYPFGTLQDNSPTNIMEHQVIGSFSWKLHFCVENIRQQTKILSVRPKWTTINDFPPLIPDFFWSLLMDASWLKTVHASKPLQTPSAQKEILTTMKMSLGSSKANFLGIIPLFRYYSRIRDWVATRLHTNNLEKSELFSIPDNFLILCG